MVAVARVQPSRRNQALVLGTSGMALLGLLSFTLLGPSIENELRRQAVADLQAAGLGDLVVDFSGRDGLVSGNVADEASAELARELVRSTSGVRQVDSVISLLPTPTVPATVVARPRLLDAVAINGKLTLEGLVPTIAARDALVSRGEAAFGRGQVMDRLQIAPGTPAAESELAAFGDALGALRLPGAGRTHLGWQDGRYLLDGTVVDDAAKGAAGALAAKMLGTNASLTNALVSQNPTPPPTSAAPAPTPPPVAPAPPAPPIPTAAELTGQLNAQPIVFELSSAVFSPASVAALDAATAVLKAQPAVRLQVGGHTDTSGSAAFNDWLGRLRAEAVVTALIQRGIDPSRLVPVSLGSATPVSPTDQSKNRRIEFTPLP